MEMWVVATYHKKAKTYWLGIKPELSYKHGWGFTIFECPDSDYGNWRPTGIRCFPYLDIALTLMPKWFPGMEWKCQDAQERAEEEKERGDMLMREFLPDLMEVLGPDDERIKPFVTSEPHNRSGLEGQT